MLTGSDQPDSMTLETKVRDIERLKGDQRIAFIRSVGEAARVLTDDQRAALLGTQRTRGGANDRSARFGWLREPARREWARTRAATARNARNGGHVIRRALIGGLRRRSCSSRFPQAPRRRPSMPAIILVEARRAPMPGMAPGAPMAAPAAATGCAGNGRMRADDGTRCPPAGPAQRNGRRRDGRHDGQDDGAGGVGRLHGRRLRVWCSPDSDLPLADDASCAHAGETRRDRCAGEPADQRRHGATRRPAPSRSSARRKPATTRPCSNPSA